MASKSGSEGKSEHTAAGNSTAEPGAQQSSATEPEPAAPRPRFAWLSRAHGWFEQRWGLDLRSLAIFRIGIGYLLLSDLGNRAIDLRAHYTDVGILTRERLVGGWGQKLFYSLHVAGGDWVSQSALFLVAAVFAFMLLVGYRTRLAAIVSWVLLCSLQGRNYIVLQGGDDLLRVMLFWALFLPLGVRFSVDAVLAEHATLRAQGIPASISPSTRRPLPKRLLSLAGTTLVVQLLTVYFVSAALKTGPTWHKDGSAIHLALHHHAFASSIGQWFRELPAHILQGMTWQVWWLELLGPLLFFIPWATYWWRTVQVVLFVGFHFGLFLTMELGHFPWVAIVCWLVVLPSWFWDQPLYRLTLKANLRARLRELSRRLQAAILLYQSRLGTPLRLPRVQPTLLSSLVVLGIASYAAYGSAYAMTHKGNVHGERFHPLLMSRLYANWGMFAPNPPNNSGWFVTVAKQNNGNEIDVWNGGGPVTFDKPRLPAATYKRQRWRKFGDNILSAGHAGIRGYFLRWLCLDWNEDHEKPERLQSITLYHMAQTANWPGKGYGPLAKNELARESCPPLPDEQPEAAPAETVKPKKPASKRTAKPRGAGPRPPRHPARRPRGTASTSAGTPEARPKRAVTTGTTQQSGGAGR